MNNRSLRIAIFHLGFFYSGGGEKLILKEIRGLRKLGYEINCFAPFVDKRNCYPDLPEIEEVRSLLPLPPRWLPMKDPLWVLLSCILIPFMAWRFRSYDVFFGANQPGPWFAFVLSKILRKPYVIYLAQALRILHPRVVDLENGIMIREGDTRFIKALTRVAGWLIDKADRVSINHAQIILTNGEHVCHWIREVYGVDSKVCSAGCHPVPKEKLKYSKRWHGDLVVNGMRVKKPYILLTNRHSPMKRFEYALWSLKTIHKQVANISLVITGQETEYTDQLRYLVIGLGINNLVHFVGLVTEQDLNRLYLEAALYVYPSPEEDFGMGIVEAMAAGTPVLAWNNGGPTVTVVDGVTGFLIEPYDERAFAMKMLHLATDPFLAEKLGRAGYQRAMQLFSYDRHNKILEEALFEAVKSYYQLTEVKETALSAPTWLDD